MTGGLHPHGGARMRAGLGPAADKPPALPEAMREQLARTEVAREDVHLAWELARLAPGLSEVDHLALVTLIVLLGEALARGSTRLSLEPAPLIERARALGAEPAVAEAIPALLARRATPPLARLFGEAGDRRPLSVDAGHLYTQRVLAVETRLCRTVVARTAAVHSQTSLHDEARARATRIEAAVTALRARPSVGVAGPVVLSGEQEHAVRTALGAPLSVIHGGPGTGKTSIVVAMLRAALEAGIAPSPASLALAAPTGKAADRMRRAIEDSLRQVAAPSALDQRLAAELPTPRTLHRLLAWSPGRRAFRHRAENPLAERLVVIDESSMIDVFLMERLLAALHPDARLVLLGDAEQLPSVAAGAVFRDLGDSARVPSVRLTKSHRMDPTQRAGANVLSVAGHVHAGRMPEVVAGWDGELPAIADAIGLLREVPSDLAARAGVALLEAGPDSTAAKAGPAMRDALLDRWLTERAGDPRTRALAERTWPTAEGRVLGAACEELEMLFARSERARLLCVTRSADRATGAEAINAALHGRLAALRRDASPAGHFLPGEPILVHRNDYARGLFNGDPGLVLFTEDEETRALRPSAVFRRDDGFVTFPIELVRASVELGHASTVHKAQGSEYDQVVLLLPETDSPRLLTREIVYTAITRARRSVLLVGSRAMLERAIARRIERTSGIRERLSLEA